MTLHDRMIRDVLLVGHLDPPGLDARRRPGTLSPPVVLTRVDQARQGRTPWSLCHLQALALLWHDDVPGAHDLVQALDDPDGQYLHGVLHRREGDYANAAFWFREAGVRPWLAPLSAQVATHPTHRCLAPHGVWNADAFLTCCAQGSPEWIPIQERELLLALAGLAAPLA